MFFNKFCEGVVALEFVASEACDWPQRQKAVLCYWRFYQWDITFQEECVRIELKGIQLAELMEQIWRQSCSIGLWLSKTPIFLIYIFICSFFNTYFRPGVSTPANAAFRKQAREDCERSSPAWATEGGESLIFTRWKKKTLIFFLYAEYLKMLNFRLSFEPVWYWLSGSDSESGVASLFLHMATWSVSSAVWDSVGTSQLLSFPLL